MNKQHPLTSQTSKQPIFIDSHCHIHDSELDLVSEEAYQIALDNNVLAMICVGTSVKSSYEAVEFCQDRPNCYYSLALHPHQVAELGQHQLEQAWQSIENMALRYMNDTQFIAIGECGLDYFYHNDSNILHKQQWLLRKHLDLASRLQKPVIFHVRDAFKDFWPIYDDFKLRGVVHSFSSDICDLNEIIARDGLYVGLNGIMTFTKDEKQLESARNTPLSKLILETDAPYLTPKPLRGKINTPANVRLVAKFLSDLRKEPIGLLADQTTTNTEELFGITVL